MPGHFIVCGMGDVGFRVVELLHRLGEKVAVITEQAREERRQAAEAFGVRVIEGDARNERLLVEAGLESARGVIAATDRDLVNIEVALDARRLRPDVPVVIRLFDQDLARQLESSLGLRRALGMSALAAPNFAAAALGDSILGSFRVGGVPYVVGRQLVGHGPLSSCASLDEIGRLHGLQTLVAERPGECVALPPVEATPRSGDRLSLVGRKEDWDRLFGVPEAPAATRAKAPRRRFRRAIGRAFGIWREEPFALRLAFLSVCVLIPVAIFVFRHYLRLTLTDAIFFTITTLHGEISLTEGGPEIKISEVLLMILGSITIATIYSMITDYLVGARLRKLLGGKPMPKKGQVVVVGMGDVGYRVVQELDAMGVPVVAVDAHPDAPVLSSVRTLAPVVVGDARLDETLERAGLARARAVVAATGDDAVNLGIGLAAHRLSPGVRTVVRLFDAEFARKVESAMEIDAAFGASRIAAPTFAASALFPDVVKAVIVQDRLFILRSVRAGEQPAGEGDLVRLLPLVPGEDVLAVQWRKLEPPWSEQTPQSSGTVAQADDLG